MNMKQLLHDFFTQEVPHSKQNTVPYYLESLALNDVILDVYFALTAVILVLATGRVTWVPVIALAVVAAKHWLMKKGMPIRLVLLAHALLLWGWCAWCAVTFGLGYGGQHFLMLIVLLAFFSVFEPPLFKVLYFLVTLALRIVLYNYARNHVPDAQLGELYAIICQVLNSIALYVILAGCCIIYSSNLQESMRQLMLHNERLQHQAETDPLTKLYNRRYMMYEMSHELEQNPSLMFCVAIADIDFFKKVNDTYGHNCGDYVLQKLAALLAEQGQGRYTVARWGGEEFCFFIPNVNLDEAGTILYEVCAAVRRMEMEFEGNRVRITLTAGVEDNDYHSSLETLIERADRKLYMGKAGGRDQVVI